MTCDKCKNFKKTKMQAYDLKPYLGQGLTLEQVIEKAVAEQNPQSSYDCIYANDWCKADSPINTLCDNKFEPKKA